MASAAAERLGSRAAVKGTMLQAHLSWAEAHLGSQAHAAMISALGPDDAAYARRGVLATEWVPFATLVRIDRAIAAAARGPAEDVYRELGRHSALSNLAGAYKGFLQEEPHRFFESTGRLHSRFQNFGRAAYERLGDRAGRLRIQDYDEYSPVFCGSAIGYYLGALEAMGAPGPVARETSCQCRGEAACTFEITW